MINLAMNWTVFWTTLTCGVGGVAALAVSVVVYEFVEDQWGEDASTAAGLLMVVTAAAVTLGLLFGSFGA